MKKIKDKILYLITWLKFYHLTEELDSYYYANLLSKRKRLVLNYLAYYRYIDKNKYDAIGYAMFRVHHLWGVDAITKKEIDNFFHV